MIMNLMSNVMQRESVVIIDAGSKWAMSLKFKLLTQNILLVVCPLGICVR